MKIAIVGTGVSGLVAAHMLHPHHEITVFESDTRIGGHANTVDVEVDGRSVAVDTGFIVYNDRNYPGFRALLDRLGVATQPTEMSFSVSDPRTGLEFRGSNLNAIFAQRRNLANPSFLRLLADITRFNRAARRLVAGETRWNGPDRLPDGGGFDAALPRSPWPISYVEAGSRNHSCGSSSSPSARRSGRPIRRPSCASPCARVPRVSWTTMGCSTSPGGPNGAP